MQPGNIKATVNTVETIAATTGLGLSLATWQQYTTLSAGISGVMLSLAMVFHYINKTFNEKKQLKILEKEVDERIRLEAKKAASEEKRLDDYKEFAINHNDRRNRNLTPEQLFNELVKDENILKLLKSRIISGELAGDEDGESEINKHH